MSASNGNRFKLGIVIGAAWLATARVATAQLGACCLPGGVCQDSVAAVDCAGQHSPGAACSEILCQDCISPVDCDDGLPCTVDDCVGGICRNDPLPAGTACDDGDACTINDTCQGRFCIGDPPTLQFDSFPVAPLGQAILDVIGPRMQISNIGTTGLDGVSVCFSADPAGRRPFQAGLRWEPVSLSGSVSGIIPPPKIVGGGKPPQSNASVAGVFPDLIGASFERDDLTGQIVVTPLMAPLGAATVRVDVFLGGTLLQSVPGLPATTPVAHVGAFPTTLIGGRFDQTASAEVGAIIRFVSPVAVSVLGPGSTAGVLTTDEIHLVAENPTASIQGLDAFELRITTIPQLTATDVIARFTIPPIPAVAGWGLIAAGVILAAGGAWTIRRRVHA
ncbi:MAG: hypothetical protein D6788_08245 [Planctomycetota bacterium]|nr:MAG: hypothetical protein D6788_08245 [Planctomycetota bacterium]